MKKMMAIMACTALLWACKSKKSDEVQPPAQTKENIAGLYKLTALTLTTSSSSETSIYDSYVSACQKDDLQQLKVDFTTNYIDAGTKCSPAGDRTGTWALPATGKITIEAQTFDIVSFSGTVLVISQVQNVAGSPTTFKSTFTKQ